MRQKEIRNLLIRTADALNADLEIAKVHNNMDYFQTILDTLKIIKTARERMELHVSQQKESPHGSALS
jgi:hypothetical protein